MIPRGKKFLITYFHYACKIYFTFISRKASKTGRNASRESPRTSPDSTSGTGTRFKTECAAQFRACRHARRCRRGIEDV